MAKVLRGISDFWNLIQEELQRVLNVFLPAGGDAFSKFKDIIASLLGKTADAAEAREEEE